MNNRYLSSNTSMLARGVVFYLAGLGWAFISLHLVSDSWAGVIIAYGPALLLIAAGSVIFWLGIYRMFFQK